MECLIGMAQEEFYTTELEVLSNDEQYLMGIVNFTEIDGRTVQN